VIRVTDTTPDVDTGISFHDFPWPFIRIGVTGQDCSILELGNTVGISVGDVDGFATDAVTVFGPMRLASDTSDQWFIASNPCVIHKQIRIWYEKPFSLADESSVLASNS
jgi:hypothetical protein